MIIFDLDGTLTDDSWRRHLWPRVAAGEICVQEYVRMGRFDAPNDRVLGTFRAMVRAGFQPIVCTARHERHRIQSLTWLARVGVDVDAAGFRLLMRPETDTTHPSEGASSWKKQLLEDIVVGHTDVTVIDDDRLMRHPAWSYVHPDDVALLGWL